MRPKLESAEVRSKVPDRKTFKMRLELGFSDKDKEGEGFISGWELRLVLISTAHTEKS
jgi:hypothetical protein